MTTVLPALESFADLANPPKTWQQGIEAVLSGAVDYDESRAFIWACEAAAEKNGYEHQDWPCTFWQDDDGNLDVKEPRESDKDFFRNIAKIADR